MMVLKCDRCKTVMEDPVADSCPPGWSGRVRNTLTGKRFDLCKTCIEAVSQFIAHTPAAPWHLPSDDDPNVTVQPATITPAPTRTPTEMTLPRPPECFEGEDTYRWLLAEALWVAGDFQMARHQIRIRENGYDTPAFEHDSVQRDCNEGHPPPDQG